MFIISPNFLSPVLTLKDEHSSRLFEEGAEGKFDPKKNYDRRLEENVEGLNKLYPTKHC
jgi:hypothetical protein